MASSKPSPKKKKPARVAPPKVARGTSGDRAKAPARRRSSTRAAQSSQTSQAKRGRAERSETVRAKGTVHTPALDRVLEAAEVEGYLARLPPPLQPMVTRLRAILLDSAPEALEFLEHETPSYFARGVFARIEPREREVLVRFIRGGSLPSSDELGGIGEERTLKLSSLEELKTEVLQKLVREAVALNLTLGGQMPAEA